MERARRHQRLLSFLAFGLLALVAELVGRSMTHRLDLGQHVQTPRYAGAEYYPFLLAAVKTGIALLLARLLWRVGRARRLLAAVERRRLHGARAPRLRLRLSPRLWAGVFALTSLLYLAQTNAEAGRSSLDPWLHSSALPVFAVLAVVVAFVWGVVQRWLADFERYVERAVAFARRAPAPLKVAHAAESSTANPRRLFGLAFESRPPPLAA
jgi:hypothetical protein